MNVPSEHARLDALEARIQHLEGWLADSRSGGFDRKYYESGSIHPELDDQSITP